MTILSGGTLVSVTISPIQATIKEYSVKSANETVRYKSKKQKNYIKTAAFFKLLKSKSITFKP